jgi:hypothetical protein
MIQHSPPWLLERMLICFLPVRDRETISGDLFEEYWQDQVPRVGSLRANIWYARQVISFLSIRSFGGLPEKAGLTCTSLLTAGIGCWLMAMEQVLRHSGYAERTAIATCIMLQGISTLLVLMFGVGSICRAVVLLSAVSLALFGAFSIERILQSEHFEGFVLIIGVVLIAQGLMTLVVVPRLHSTKAR